MVAFSDKLGDLSGIEQKDTTASEKITERRKGKRKTKYHRNGMTLGKSHTAKLMEND